MAYRNDWYRAPGHTQAQRVEKLAQARETYVGKLVAFELPAVSYPELARYFPGNVRVVRRERLVGTSRRQRIETYDLAVVQHVSAVRHAELWNDFDIVLYIDWPVEPHGVADWVRLEWLNTGLMFVPEHYVVKEQR